MGIRNVRHDACYLACRKHRLRSEGFPDKTEALAIKSEMDMKVKMRMKSFFLSLGNKANVNMTKKEKVQDSRALSM